MKRTTITRWAPVLAGLALLASPAFSDHRRADVPPRLVVLAHEIDETAARLLRDAEVLDIRPYRRYDRFEDAAEDLARRARHFHRRVEEGWKGRGHLLRDLDRVARELDRAWALAEATPMPRRIYRKLERLDRLVNEAAGVLEARAYGVRSRHRDAYRTRVRVRAGGTTRSGVFWDIHWRF